MTACGNVEERRFRLRPGFSRPAMKGIPAHKSDKNSPRTRHDWIIYLLAALSGIGIGCLDVAIDDLLFTALLVLMACMLLGMLRPRWPWRWAVTVAISMPLTELAAYLIQTAKPARGQMYGSILLALPGTAGAYGGAVVRRMIENLRQ